MTAAAGATLDFGEGLFLIDLPQGMPGFRQFIASWFFVDALGRRVVVDPGPANTIPLLNGALERLTEDVDLVLLTHIHLDHAGGVGAFCRRWPHAGVLAHPRAFAHLRRPDRLWSASVRTLGNVALAYGEPEPLTAPLLSEDPDGLIEVFPTPGHAPHHVALRTRPREGGPLLFIGGAAAGRRIRPARRPAGPNPGGGMTIRIVLVDDQEMYRLGFRMLLETRQEVEVIGEAEDGRAAVELISRVEADVVLMDVRMPRMNGIEATRRIAARAPGPRVLVLTTFDLDEYAFEAIRAGAGGFLLKDASLEELMAAIHHVHAGDAVMAPSTTRRLLERFAVRPPAVGPGRTDARMLESLTAREREVLLLLARGLTNGGIARELSVAEGTVRVHVSRILGKLELRDRAQAVVLAYESGLVAPGRGRGADDGPLAPGRR